MKIETTTGSDGTTSQHFIAEPGEHLIYTGKVTGLKTLEDGRTVNLSPDYVAVPLDPKVIAEVHDLIGEHWVANGHPDDVDVLVHPETGEQVPVQRPFVYKKERDGQVLVGVGHPHGEHPLDEHNGILPAMADARIAAARKKKG